jgi:hypothetical protein
VPKLSLNVQHAISLMVSQHAKTAVMVTYHQETVNHVLHVVTLLPNVQHAMLTKVVLTALQGSFQQLMVNHAMLAVMLLKTQSHAH